MSRSVMAEALRTTSIITIWAPFPPREISILFTFSAVFIVSFVVFLHFTSDPRLFYISRFDVEGVGFAGVTFLFIAIVNPSTVREILGASVYASFQFIWVNVV